MDGSAAASRLIIVCGLPGSGKTTLAKALETRHGAVRLSRRTTMPAGAICMLRLVRRSGFADWLRRYKIFIDGAQVGTIARNSVLDLEVPSGPLTIGAHIDWARSQPLTIEATPDQRTEVEVSNH